MIWSVSARSLHNSIGNNELCTRHSIPIALCTLCSRYIASRAQHTPKQCESGRARVWILFYWMHFPILQLPRYGCTFNFGRLHAMHTAARGANAFRHSIDGYRLCDECKIFRMNRMSHWFTICMIRMVRIGGNSDAKCRIMPLCACIVNEPETVQAHTHNASIVHQLSRI